MACLRIVVKRRLRDPKSGKQSCLGSNSLVGFETKTPQIFGLPYCTYTVFVSYPWISTDMSKWDTTVAMYPNTIHKLKKDLQIQKRIFKDLSFYSKYKGHLVKFIKNACSGKSALQLSLLIRNRWKKVVLSWPNFTCGSNIVGPSQLDNFKHDHIVAVWVYQFDFSTEAKWLNWRLAINWIWRGKMSFYEPTKMQCSYKNLDFAQHSI